MAQWIQDPQHSIEPFTLALKNPSFSHIPVFRWKLIARQLPLNTAKNLNRKTHLRSVVF